MTKKTTIRNTNKSKSKRWHFNAAYGPFSLSFGSADQAPSSNKGKRSIPTDGEEKYFSSSLSTAALTHGTVYTFNPLAQIVAGTGVTQRIGNAIHLDKIQVSLNISTTGMVTKTGCNWRFLIVVSTKQYNPSSSSFGSGLGTTDLFLNTSNACTSPVDPRVAWVLCDKMIEIEPKISGADTVRFTLQSCQIDKDFEYNTAASTYGVSSNIYIVLVPNIAGGVSGTTVVGAVQEATVTTAFRNN